MLSLYHIFILVSALLRVCYCVGLSLHFFGVGCKPKGGESLVEVHGSRGECTDDHCH